MEVECVQLFLHIGAYKQTQSLHITMHAVHQAYALNRCAFMPRPLSCCVNEHVCPLHESSNKYVHSMQAEISAYHVLIWFCHLVCRVWQAQRSPNPELTTLETEPHLIATSRSRLNRIRVMIASLRFRSKWSKPIRFFF